MVKFPISFILLIILLPFPGCNSKTSSQSAPKNNPTTKNRTPGQNDEDKIKVLSYNICWECMTNNNRGKFSKGTASTIGAKCKYLTNSNTTICAENIGKFIEKTEQTYGELDFVALQEAANWKVLLKEAGNTLKKMQYEEHNLYRNKMVTFYDPKQFTLEFPVINWGFKNNDRPYQILIFSEKLIFINLHNCHGSCGDKKFVQKRLSNSLKKRLTPQEITKISKYRIIMAGDFNDTQKLTLAKITPFEGVNIGTKATIQSPPKTCCSQQAAYGKKWSGFRPGDYVLDSSSGLKRLFVPKNYPETSPLSDHLPVLGILPEL